MFSLLKFLPRDAVHMRGLCAVSVCPSVCVSVTFVSSVETSNRIVRIFSQSGSHTILVFTYQRDGDILTGTPLTGASNAGGV